MSVSGTPNSSHEYKRAELSIARVLSLDLSGGARASLLTLALINALKEKGLSCSVGMCSSHLQLAYLYTHSCSRFARTAPAGLTALSDFLRACIQLQLGSELILVDGTSAFSKDKVNQIDPWALDVAREIDAPIICIARYGDSNARERLFEVLRATQKEGANRAVLIVSDCTSLDKLDSYAQSVVEGSGVECIGHLPRFKELDLLFDEEISCAFSDQRFSMPYGLLADLSKLVKDNINIDHIVQLASRCSKVTANIPQSIPTGRVRIALALDNAFSLSFPDNFDLLRYFGGDLVKFSALADRKLPSNCNAIYLSNGFLCEYADDLFGNKDLKSSIKNSFDSGMPVYAEGLSLGYLAQSFAIKGIDNLAFDGVGALPAHLRLKGRCTNQLFRGSLVEDTILGLTEQEINGIYPRGLDLRVDGSVMRTTRSQTRDTSSFLDGFSPTAHSYLSTGILHWGANPEMAKAFIDSAVTSAAKT